MKTTKQLLIQTVASIALLLCATAGGSFASAITFHGSFFGGQFFCAGDPVSTPAISGNWNVNIDPNTPAQVTLNVFYNDKHHLSEGYNALMLVSYANGVYVFTGFGDHVTATLDTNATPLTFAWHVDLAPGCPPNHPYDSLTFFGSGVRGANQ